MCRTPQFDKARFCTIEIARPSSGFFLVNLLKEFSMASAVEHRHFICINLLQPHLRLSAFQSFFRLFYCSENVLWPTARLHVDLN